MDTVNITELAVAVGIKYDIVARWWRNGLLPEPIPERRRRRSVRFHKAEALKVARRLADAHGVLFGDQGKVKIA